MPNLKTVKAWRETLEDSNASIEVIDNIDWLIVVAEAAHKVVHKYGELCPYTGNCITDHYPNRECDCGYQKLKDYFQ